jgi:prevent-host-death family protein
MTVHVNVQEAKTHLSRLLTQVEEGIDIVIDRHGLPVARLVPTPPEGPVQFGCLPGEVSEEALQPLDEEELEYWHGGRE